MVTATRPGTLHPPASAQLRLLLDAGRWHNYTVCTVRFDWDRHNRAHLARHPDVSEAEIEEVLTGEFIVVAAGVADGEQRYECVGKTVAGRLLMVVVTWRGDAVRPITAYSAEGWRARMYLEE